MKTFTYAVLGLVSSFLLGCGAVDTAVDCNRICNRYKTCYNNSYDTGTCQTRCRNSNTTDTGYSSKANSCEACMDDKSCASTTFSCPSCIGIVP